MTTIGFLVFFPPMTVTWNLILKFPTKALSVHGFPSRRRAGFICTLSLKLCLHAFSETLGDYANLRQREGFYEHSSSGFRAHVIAFTLSHKLANDIASWQSDINWRRMFSTAPKLSTVVSAHACAATATLSCIGSTIVRVSPLSRCNSSDACAAISLSKPSTSVSSSTVRVCRSSNAFGRLQCWTGLWRCW